MENSWHCLQHPGESDSCILTAQARPAEESLWFNGHFPGAPILPGIAQIAMVSDLLKWHAEKHGTASAISSLSRVRFRQFIRPGDAVSVTVTPDEQDPSAFKFKIVVDGQIACNGLARTAARAV
jgi:3-hydroxyacyl-[acyl-carrier-protein] dehydratase